MESIVTTTVQKSRFLLKGLLIAGLILLLMIPAWFVKDLVQEREARQQEAFTEVSSKWAGKQNFTGPILVIPYNEPVKLTNGTTGTQKKYAYLLPDKLSIAATVNPEKKYRGIYEVMLYTAQLNIQGSFSPATLHTLQLPAEAILWKEAYVCATLTDAKGLKEQVSLQWNDTVVTLEPTSLRNNILQEGFAAPVTISPERAISFSGKVVLNGSQQLLFTPLGKETTVTMASAWPDPSFTGSQLPLHQITENGFEATWKSFSHSRNFPQVWKDQNVSFSSADFGTELFIPVNTYQKTMRSVKYAMLCIILTFAAFFLIETIHKKAVHPFQYCLIGLALLLFYTLLLSIGEYTGFNIAYSIASLATILLIAWFVKGILQSGKLTTILSVVLALLYSYVFSILQLQDYSLLLGSIGLFLTLAAIMNFSKKIQW